jgi:hypothetical protein
LRGLPKAFVHLVTGYFLVYFFYSLTSFPSRSSSVPEYNLLLQFAEFTSWNPHLHSSIWQPCLQSPSSSPSVHHSLELVLRNNRQLKDAERERVYCTSCCKCWMFFSLQVVDLTDCSGFATNLQGSFMQRRVPFTHSCCCPLSGHSEQRKEKKEDV